jgi:hypothetical protein
MVGIRSLAAVAVCAALTGRASAQPPNLYGVAHIGNESAAKATVYFKWGTNGTWKKHVIEKGKKVAFAWKYDGTSKSSPTLYVRIDVDTDGVRFVEHTLSRGQSPDNNAGKYGHHFAVKQLAGTDTRYIEAVTPRAEVKVTDAKTTAPKVK